MSDLVTVLNGLASCKVMESEKEIEVKSYTDLSWLCYLFGHGLWLGSDVFGRWELLKFDASCLLSLNDGSQLKPWCSVERYFLVKDSFQSTTQLTDATISWMRYWKFLAIKVVWCMLLWPCINIWKVFFPQFCRCQCYLHTYVAFPQKNHISIVQKCF